MAKDKHFEWDRDMAEFNSTCIEEGNWTEPLVWPGCVHSELSAD